MFVRWIGLTVLGGCRDAGDSVQDAVSLRAILLQGAYAFNSNKSYKSSLNTYERFLKRYPDWEPWTDVSVAAWLLDGIYNMNWRKSTLNTRLIGITHQFQVVRRIPLDSSTGSVVHLAKRMVARLGDDSEPKFPLKIEALAAVNRMLKAKWSPYLINAMQQICPRVTAQDLRVELLAWFNLAFACFLRAQETASLSWEDVEIDMGTDGSPCGGAITLRTSRFVVYKTSTSTVRIERKLAARTDVCPVRSLLELLEHKRKYTGPVFRVSVEQARKALQFCAESVTKQPASGSGLHSLRAGAACSADEAGVNLASIMFLGRWLSAAVLCYLRSQVDGAKVLLLKGSYKGQGTRRGETRSGLRL